MSLVKKLFGSLDSTSIQKLAAFAALLLLIIVFSFLTPYFFNYDNLITVFKQTTVTAIVALGVTIVIITAGIDLSLGSLVAVTGMTATMVLTNGGTSLVAIIVAIITGCLLGLFSGVVISYLKIPPFIATLGVMISARGLALVLSGGRPVYFTQNTFFNKIYSNDFLFVPMPVIYLFLLFFITWFLLNKSVIGRYIFAVGSNEETARLSGVPVYKTKIFAYMFSGFMCAVAGILMISRLSSGQPSIASGLELDAIAATVIGGTSLAGGEGTVLGTLIGALIMSVLRNGLNLMQVNQFWQQVLIGLVVILAVYLDILRRQREAVKK